MLQMQFFRRSNQAGTFDVDIDGDGTVDHTIPFFNVDIGSTNRAFRDIYAKRGIFADKTIIGTASQLRLLEV